MYPLKMQPYYRHGEETPWGGRALRDMFGKDIPDDRTGESLEISALGGMASTVANGEYAGKTLPEMIDLWGEGLTGLPAGTTFPLLMKLLDAREMLSVQVHPGDAYAMANDGKLGKTEAWVVLWAPRGSKLVYGVDAQNRPLRDRVEANELEQALRWIEVSPGDVLYIPHGLVHALGDGIMVYEIQQSSDATYRFWDWGRLGADGQPRALHMDKALDVTRAELNPEKVKGATIITRGGSKTAYISDTNFELWRLNVAGDMPLESGRMWFLTPLGECTLTWPNGQLSLLPGDSVLVPAGLEGVSLVGHLPVLCSTTPDQNALREALGYRADDVAGLNEH